MTSMRTPPAPDRGGIYGVEGRSAWLDVDWPAHQRWLAIDGSWANVIELGEGPPMLFVHGLAGCWQNWLETLPHFAATHRVVAVDLPGFGASEMPRKAISIARYASFLEQLCDALAIDAATVVGNSMGGFVVAELAIASPQRVEQLVLVSAAGITAESLWREPVLAGGRVLAMTAAWAASRHETFARRPGLRRLALSFVARHPDRLSAPIAHELMQGSGTSGFLPALDATIGYPLRERLPQIAAPTLIVWGEKDRVIPVRDAARFEQLIPDARKVILPDTGHVSMVERPASFNALVEEFLSAPEPTPETVPLSA
jgi:pimeloyl-ACP methyl ester carboxylesterase